MALPSDEEFKKILKKIDEDIQKSLNTQIDSWLEIFTGKKNGEEPTGIMGSSPIRKSLDEIRKMTLITSCITCIHWIVDKEVTYLLGVCELSTKRISYDRTCENWIKIGNK